MATQAKTFRQNTATPANAGGGSVQPVLPSTTQAQLLGEQLFNSSGYNNSILNQVSIVPNSTIQFNLINTGLTDKVMLSLNGQIAYKNTSGSAQAISLSPEFPLNMISNLQVTYNGQVTLVSASGYELMSLNAARSKAGYLQQVNGVAPSQNLTRISNRKMSITAGSNITLTAGNTLSGYSAVTVAANTTGILNYSMVLEVPFVWRHDIPLGLLPMQNNTIICQVQITAPSILGTTPLSPTYVAGSVPATLSIDTVTPTYLNAIPVQFYWETPANAALYQYFVANSYMFISVPGQKFTTTGSQALQYLMPNNYILTKMLFTLRDSNSNLLDCYNNVTNAALNYNNTTTVDKMPQSIREYLQEMRYEAAPTGLGQLLWDACTHNYEAQNLSDSSFLDLYKANNPMFLMDIGASVSVPGTFSIAREMLVPSNVKLG